MKRALILTTVLSICVFPALAQEKAKRYLRLLPLGEVPTFHQVIRDGVRIEQEPEPGTIPPNIIELLLTKDKATETTLRLEQFTEKIEIPNGAAKYSLNEKKAELSKKWHEFSLPEQGDVLLCLWRDPQKNTWEQARSLVVPDGKASFPAGSLRIINLLPSKMRITTEKGVTEFKGGEVKIVPLVQETTSMQVSAVDQHGAWGVFYQSGVTQHKDERGNLIVYKADGETPRSPVKVWLGRERAP